MCPGSGERREDKTHGSAAHHLLGHVNRLAAPSTHISSSPSVADVVVADGVGGADYVLLARGREFGSKERLRRRRNVAGRLRPVTRFHGQNSRSATISVPFGSEALAVTGTTVNVTVMLRQVAAVQTTVAVFVRCLHMIQERRKTNGRSSH